MRRQLPGGLRWRFLLALLVTSAITLGATALVVLPPLQDWLREQNVRSLETAVEETEGAFAAAFAQLEENPGLEVEDRIEGYGTAFFEAVAQVETRIPTVRVLVQDDSTVPSNPAQGPPGFVYDSEFASRPSRAQLHIANIAGLRGPTTQVEGDTVRVARPLYVEDRFTGVVLAERELSEVATLVSLVRTRFLIAAVVGLVVAALLAIALSSTLLRRLNRLRAAALRGADAQMPHDERRDEVGDLARALARMQEELRRQEAARRAFVSTASHELRTPLTMLQGTMELLEEDIRSGRLNKRDALRQVADARRELDRLSALSGELLDLSRLDAAVPLRAEPVELSEIVRAVAAEFELRARNRSTSIHVILPEGPCWGLGDPDAVARVVRILLDNALRYGPHGAPVQVEAHSATGGGAVITVADQGAGIPEEERDRIFERFHRGSAAGSAGGFGLGLAIGRELARRMGGELDVDSEAAHGTRFALTLRTARSPATEPPARDRVSA